MDASGRLVIPQQIRRRAGLRPGFVLDVRWASGHIETEPESCAVRLERRRRFLVAVPEGDIKEITTNVVEATRQSLIAERSP
jgi:bifunctional DNA-binding transcriptional regulator/antitoxin component of YhaV-PrlF toxin-antitoxin module